MYTNVYTINENDAYKRIQKEDEKMKSERNRDRGEGRHHHGEGHKRKRHERGQGAKTFRRGRAITFVERMNIRRDTLKKQLETPELQTVHPILVGELKAIDMVIDEFIQLFELYEIESGGEQEEEKSSPGAEDSE